MSDVAHMQFALPHCYCWPQHFIVCLLQESIFLSSPSKVGSGRRSLVNIMQKRGSYNPINLVITLLKHLANPSCCERFLKQLHKGVGTEFFHQVLAVCFSSAYAYP